MSLARKGVDYVARLPGSHFPEKVIFWWDPTSTDSLTRYVHDGITFGGQTYDLIKVNGYGRDPDEWDKDVFLHEYGHFVMDNYAATPPTGQECVIHFWADSSGYACAYKEGWAHFFSGACQDDQVYLDTGSRGDTLSLIDLELPTSDPQGSKTEGAVCASLWDIFDASNDSTIEIGGEWYHNCDLNGGLWWQGINLIWWTTTQPGDLGHFPYTICEFGHVWGWSPGYPVDYTWCCNFVAHGIICDVCDPVGVADGSASKTDSKPFLWPNRPNPFNPLTQVAFRIASYGKVSIRVCDVGGRVVRTLVDAYKEPGSYTVWWDGKDDSGASLASGVYLCQLVVGSFKQTRKLVMLR
jgi:hypothetical protein